VTFRKNVLRHSGAGFNILATDNTFPSQQTKRILIHPGFVATFSHRVLNRTIDGRAYGVQFEGTQGVLLVDRGGYEFRPEPDRVGDETTPSSRPAVKDERSAQHLPHVQNFLDA
jgi:hypothetical protein